MATITVAHTSYHGVVGLGRINELADIVAMHGPDALFKYLDNTEWWKLDNGEWVCHLEGGKHYGSITDPDGNEWLVRELWEPDANEVKLACAFYQSGPTGEVRFRVWDNGLIVTLTELGEIYARTVI